MADLASDATVIGLIVAMGSALVFVVRQQMTTMSEMLKAIMEKPPVCAVHEEMANTIQELKVDSKETRKDVGEIKVSTAEIQIQTKDLKSRLDAIAGNGAMVHG